MAERHGDLIRDTLAVVFLFALIAATLWILWPFLPAVVWATMIVVATWPFMLRLQHWFFGRRWLAVTVMTLLLLAVFLLPFSYAIGAFVEHFGQILTWTKTLSTFTVPPPPDWLGKIPVAGARAAANWQQFSALSQEELAARFSPYLGGIVQWVAVQAGSFGLLLTHVVLTMLVSVVFYATGESAATMVLRFGARLGGAQGEQSVRLAGQAIRGVALGVVVTALVQAVLGGIGLAIVGVPFAMMLTVVIFIAAIVQLGVTPVLLPAVAWLYWTGNVTAGIVLLVWTLFVVPVDNILRPILIKKGADLPLLLILAGVLGGLFSFGIVGLFVGPVVLAVAYTLFTAWTNENIASSRTETVPVPVPDTVSV